VVQERLAWLDAQPDLDAERLVFIDETGASTRRGSMAARGVAVAA